MLLPPAKKQKTLACIREIQVHNFWTRVYSQKVPGLVHPVTVEVAKLLQGCSLAEVGVVAHGAGLLDITLLHINDGARVLAVQQVADWQVIGAVFVLKGR